MVKIRTQNERPARVMKILVSVKEYVARAFLVYRLSTSVEKVPSFVYRPGVRVMHRRFNWAS